MRLLLSVIRASPSLLRAELQHEDCRKIFHPRGFAAQPLKQASRSNSQFGPITSGTVGGATCWVPTVGGGVGTPRTLTHVSNELWQIVKHPACTILFFGMGVKLPAKLAGIDAKRIIAATPSFIFTPESQNLNKFAPRLNQVQVALAGRGRPDLARLSFRPTVIYLPHVVA